MVKGTILTEKNGYSTMWPNYSTHFLFVYHMKSSIFDNRRIKTFP